MVPVEEQLSHHPRYGDKDLLLPALTPGFYEASQILGGSRGDPRSRSSVLDSSTPMM